MKEPHPKPKAGENVKANTEPLASPDLDETQLDDYVRTHAEQSTEPTLEELIAYELGELDDDAAEALRERLVLFPKAVKTLRELQESPSHEVPNEISVDTDESWTAFQDLINDQKIEGLKNEDLELSDQKTQTLWRIHPGLNGLLIAASLLFGVLAGFWLGKSQEMTPILDAGGLTDVFYNNVREGAVENIDIQFNQSSHHILRLHLDRTWPLFPRYRVALINAQDAVALQRDVYADRQKTLNLILNAIGWPEGRYRLRIFGLNDDEDILLGEREVLF